jgi:sodium-dependent dicarboxylate transporter 2/3/5
MGASGASRFLAGAVLDAVRDAPPRLVLLGVVVFMVLLIELVSDTASAALLPPVAAAMGLSPVAAAAAIAVSASCAFMLPVATPPNASCSPPTARPRRR